ncbi:MAG: hypothetical protein AAF830_10200 [Pseudomonadota bacterium]
MRDQIEAAAALDRVEPACELRHPIVFSQVEPPPATASTADFRP